MEANSYPTRSLNRSLEDHDELIEAGPSKRVKFDAAEPGLKTREAAQNDVAQQDNETEKAKATSQRSGDRSKSKRGKDKDRGRDRRRGTRATEGGGRDGDEPKGPRLPKRQQPDPNLRTIEGVLFNALVKVGAVSQDNADDPVKVNLGRAARTDAGVHAAGNAVSMKLITPVPGVPDLVARMNEELPPEIRLWSILRVQNGFNARTTCDSRKYTYFFPSYLMIPPKPGSGLHHTLQDHGTDTQPDPFWSDDHPESILDDLRRKRTYRINSKQVEALRLIAQAFNGSHNFHNFTIGRDFGDRSCVRHIKSITIADPVVYGETEWISVLFHGQSFMLHQIVSVLSDFTIRALNNVNISGK
ncbi:uncharacterized protein FIBRA_00598 [Fibroporia radiculosa]|uniref:Pseudouridine synthase I TruA alpha/beta domain-containing protein n=1 Tax=Fibroporia radiculosa TaxID=599839 RepID=J4I810_9APHY|nr:uncharacterized protein FIBRA_00598 [Fibroporia radiculosa]CCL98596.1 predicted protein [Fibroporia radiculosa]